MSPSRLLKILALFCATRFTNSEWTGCSDPNLSPLVTVGEKTTICLVLSNNLNWKGTNSTEQEVNYLRLNFQPVADEFSRFIVPASYRNLVNERATKLNIFDANEARGSKGNIAIHVSSQKALSYQKLYFDKGQGKVYPQLTAIIDVKDGVVKDIVWDDGCIFCKDSDCGKNAYKYDGTLAELSTPAGSCEKTKATCDEGISSQSTLCDIAFHVVWTGTDADGTPFQSSAYRFSAFPTQDFVDSLNIPTSFSDLGISIGS